MCYGDFTRRVRLSAGLSQPELATLVGTSQAPISAHEHDRRLPSVHVLNNLVSACGFVLIAEAGDVQVMVPFPEAGWFPEEEPWPSGPSFPAGASPETAPGPGEKAVQLDAVLALVDAVRAAKA
jgi:transcriptional regulator with XRE-family HTH domain